MQHMCSILITQKALDNSFNQISIRDVMNQFTRDDPYRSVMRTCELDVVAAIKISRQLGNQETDLCWR